MQPPHFPAENRADSDKQYWSFDKNMPGGTLYKKKKTRILTFISTSWKGKLQYKQKQLGYNGQSSQRIYLSDWKNKPVNQCCKHRVGTKENHILKQEA